jgi:hypothetical protein
LAINNRQLSRSLFVRVARACAKRSSLIALAQLSARAAALKSLFIGAQSGASIHGQHTFDFSMRSRNHVYADQLSDSARCCRTCIGRRFNRANIAAHKDRHIAGADVLLSE